MEFNGGSLYHVYNQGNNRQRIFFSHDNYLFFLQKMKVHLSKYCEILAWCLMPNHFHWMVYVPDGYEELISDQVKSKNLNPINKEISVLLSSYTQAINKSQNRSGSLFRKRTKSKCLNLLENSDDYYPLGCFLYIHQNPLKAGLSNSLEEWPYASFPDYAGIRNGKICNVDLTRELLNLPSDRNEFIKFSYQTLNEEILDNIF